ncbi:hypothetical protein [Pseudonocardia ammonioxydans]|uniref:hypothetical protein n=1 Tax=Pseudonocardia ammonioxydans TaxID=260086 RepID=UPI0011603FA0|nr:hypothetical protein [Pseudonocardia ammonioxydans]
MNYEMDDITAIVADRKAIRLIGEYIDHIEGLPGNRQPVALTICSVLQETGHDDRRPALYIRSPISVQPPSEMLETAAVMHVGATLPDGSSTHHPGLIPTAIEFAQSEMRRIHSKSAKTVYLDGNPIPCSTWDFAGATTLVPVDAKYQFSVLQTSRDLPETVALSQLSELNTLGVRDGRYNTEWSSIRRHETLGSKVTPALLHQDYLKLMREKSIN